MPPAALYYAITTAGMYRILRLTVAPKRDDAAIAIMGHELRHVVEIVSDPDIRTEADVDALFRRIGEPAGTGVFETVPALEVGRLVA